MTQFDQEIKIFEEIKNKYKPIAGCHLLLDLDAYKIGEVLLTKYEFASEEYLRMVNIEYYEKEKESVIITSNIRNIIYYDSKILFVRFDYDKNDLLEFEDKTSKPSRFKRTIKQEMELLAYYLTHPKPRTPIC